MKRTEPAVWSDALVKAVAFHHTGGNVAEARKLCAAARQNERSLFDALHFFGVCEARRGHFEQARQLLARAVELDPAASDAWLNLGSVLLELERYEQACECFDRAISLKPGYAEAIANRGHCLQGLKRQREALDCYDHALQLKPGLARIHYNRGNALCDLGRFEEAVKSFDRALESSHDDVQALNNRGLALHGINRWQDALESFDRALSIKPGFAEALNNRASSLIELGRNDEAIVSWQKALQIKPHFPEALRNCGFALQKLARYDEAIAMYRRALTQDEEQDYVYGSWLYARMQVCDWDGIEAHLAELAKQIESGKKSAPPFFVVTSLDSLDVQHKAAATWARDRYPHTGVPVRFPDRAHHDKIRIGYFSPDFRNHPVAHLIVELIETHDRSRFEVSAFSFGPAEHVEVRERIKRGADHFFDVRTLGDGQVAELAREREIDIAVDLAGFTTQSRPGIFAARAAPLQASYLGYLGTMGVDYIDYLLADRTIVPAEHEALYAEKVVCLPSYQANDSQRKISDRIFTRDELGLPPNATVYCCMNNNYKITPRMFDIWMRILQNVPESVLFLFAENRLAPANLRKEAERRGVAASRLVFAHRLPMDEHLARYRAADLFIDTSPCAAGTTASDALWAGVPVMTYLGRSFAGRVAASLLQAIGMSELIMQTPEDYEALAIELGKHPLKLKDLRTKLERNKSAHPLFDTARFRKNIEAGYAMMWERYRRGEPPAAFVVPEQE